MNIIEAAKLMKQKRKIRHPIWNKDQYIYECKWGYIVDETQNDFAFDVDQILADNWEEYKEEPKLYSFEEALKALKNWKSIVRKGGNAQYRMNNNRVICILTGITVISNARFSSDSVLANDWIILEDGEAK